MSAPLRLLHLDEPELAFAHGQQAQHPKDGLFLFGPLEEGRPAELRVGVIGTGAGIELFRRWVASVQRYLPAYKPDKAFHAAFPGFEPAFKAAWPVNPLVEVRVPDDEIRNRIRLSDRNDAIFQTVDSFASRLLRYRREEDAQPEFWCVVIPEDVYRYGRPKSMPPRNERIPSNRPFSAKVGRKVLKEGSLFTEDEAAAQIYRYGVRPSGWTG